MTWLCSMHAQIHTRISVLLTSTGMHAQSRYRCAQILFWDGKGREGGGRHSTLDGRGGTDLESAAGALGGRRCERTLGWLGGGACMHKDCGVGAFRHVGTYDEWGGG